MIITHNEEQNIGRALESLEGVADEVIVVDSYSTDHTKAICEQHKVRFESREWEGYAATKNYANSLAKYPYILSMDADEALSTELQDNILRTKRAGMEGNYSMNRLTNYCGSWIKHSGWYPDVKIRLFPKDKTKWSGEYVHEELVFSESMETKHLEGDLLHYSYYSTADHRARADKYSILTARKMHAAGKSADSLKPYLSAITRFLSMYIFKLGFLDGSAGFQIAWISAASNILKYKELRKLNNEG